MTANPNPQNLVTGVTSQDAQAASPSNNFFTQICSGPAAVVMALAGESLELMSSLMSLNSTTAQAETTNTLAMAQAASQETIAAANQQAIGYVTQAVGSFANAGITLGTTIKETSATAGDKAQLGPLEEQMTQLKGLSALQQGTGTVESTVTQMNDRAQSLLADPKNVFDGDMLAGTDWPQLYNDNLNAVNSMSDNELTEFQGKLNALPTTDYTEQMGFVIDVRTSPAPANAGVQQAATTLAADPWKALNGTYSPDEVKNAVNVMDSDQYSNFKDWVDTRMTDTTKQINTLTTRVGSTQQQIGQYGSLLGQAANGISQSGQSYTTWQQGKHQAAQQLDSAIQQVQNGTAQNAVGMISSFFSQVADILSSAKQAAQAYATNL